MVVKPGDQSGKEIKLQNYYNFPWDCVLRYTEDSSTTDPEPQPTTGNAKIRISYTLTEDNCVKIDYNMVSDADTVANFTNHCYFNLAGHNSGPVLDLAGMAGS